MGTRELSTTSASAEQGCRPTPTFHRDHVPVKAGSHKVGVTFLATNYRPTLDLIRQYERKVLENNSIPQCSTTCDRAVANPGPFVQAVRKIRAACAGIHLPSLGCYSEDACARQILATLAKRHSVTVLHSIWNPAELMSKPGRHV